MTIKQRNKGREPLRQWGKSHCDYRESRRSWEHVDARTPVPGGTFGISERLLGSRKRPPAGATGATVERGLGSGDKGCS